MNHLTSGKMTPWQHKIKPWQHKIKPWQHKANHGNTRSNQSQKHALKLHDYAIRSSALKWVKVFFDNRHQSVIVNGCLSEPKLVSSGVHQGSVLGPILFLIYINDLPQNAKSKVRLFADDTALYLTISSLNLKLSNVELPDGLK